MDKYFTFGEVNSKDFGVWISGSGTFNKPARRVQKFSVPGRNGDLTIDEGCYDNVTVTYDAFISRGFEHRFHDFMAAMMVQTGYQRLQDSYDDTHFRMGVFADEQEPEVGTLNRTGKFTLTFDCMPQRFLVSGEEWVEIHRGQSWGVTLNNPTKYTSVPVIHTAGAGYMALTGDDAPTSANATWTITVSNPTSGSLPDYINIDSDMEECYYIVDEGEWDERYQYWNNVVNIVAAVGNPYDFPMLYPGKTTIYVQTYGNVFTDLKIKPRWWEL